MRSSTSNRTGTPRARVSARSAPAPGASRARGTRQRRPPDRPRRRHQGLGSTSRHNARRATRALRPAGAPGTAAVRRRSRRETGRAECGARGRRGRRAALRDELAKQALKPVDLVLDRADRNRGARAAQRGRAGVDRAAASPSPPPARRVAAGTTKPLTPSRTTSSGPSVSVQITGTPAVSASRVTSECDSRITLGTSRTSVAAHIAGASMARIRAGLLHGQALDADVVRHEEVVDVVGDEPPARRARGRPARAPPRARRAPLHFVPPPRVPEQNRSPLTPLAASLKGYRAVGRQGSEKGWGGRSRRR